MNVEVFHIQKFAYQSKTPGRNITDFLWRRKKTFSLYHQRFPRTVSRGVCVCVLAEGDDSINVNQSIPGLSRDTKTWPYIAVWLRVTINNSPVFLHKGVRKCVIQRKREN